MNSDGNELFMTRANNYITESQRKSLGAVRFPARAIVFAKVGAAVFKERKRILAQDSCIDNNMAAFIVDERRRDVRFAHYLLTAFKMSDLVAVGALPSLNGGQLRSIPMLVPPELSVQRRIAAALTDADDLIDTLNALIVKKQAIPAPWHETSMSEVADVDPEALTASTDPRTLINYISLEDVERGEILGHTQVLFGAAPSRARRVVRDGDVLFGTVRPNLQSHAIFRGGLVRPIASTGFAVVRAANEFSDPRFLFYFLMSDMTTAQVDRIIAGSNYPAVSSGDIRRLDLVIPSLEEQRAIGLVLADCDSEVSILKRRLAKARDIKQGMMQQLLTGSQLPVEAVS